MRAGEFWMRTLGMTGAIIDTDASNAPRAALFESCGYVISVREQEWIGLSRRL